jgi:hypothetical protein
LFKDVNVRKDESENVKELFKIIIIIILKPKKPVISKLEIQN